MTLFLLIFRNCLQLIDYRNPKLIKHQFAVILGVAIITIICNGNSWHKMELCAVNKKDFFKKCLSEDYTPPTEDTFRRVLAKQDPQKFNEFLSRMYREIFSFVNKHFAIDGKNLKRSYDNLNNIPSVITNTAYVVEEHIAYSQEFITKKDSEISSNPKLLKTLGDITGSIFSIDAIGCQLSILGNINSLGAFYVIAIKENQKTLNDDTKTMFEYYNMLDPKFFPSNYHIDTVKGHGRCDKYKVTVIDISVSQDYHFDKWYEVGAKSLVEVRKLSADNSDLTPSTRYYISNKKEDAFYFYKKIVDHWAIENSLHYILDVTFKEDHSRIRKENGAKIFTMLRRVCITIIFQALKNIKMKYVNSFDDVRYTASQDSEYLHKILFG